MVSWIPLRAAAAPGLQLMVITSRDCHESADFRREVMPGYGRTPAARVAPMIEQPMDAAWPDGLAIGRMPRVTPSFLILQGGVEIARFEGYSDAATFHERLSSALSRSGAAY
ncbi:SoxS protein [Paracoccus sp. 1_MG-2023]|nr:SoxS protein [Paracoccus sp. 1_MG-2023]